MSGANTTQQQMPTLVEQLMEAAFVGRTLRDGDKAFMREVLRLKQVIADMSKALTAIKSRIAEPMDSARNRERIVNDVTRWCDAALDKFEGDT